MRFAEAHYTSAKTRAEPRLFAIPGVVGVAVGPKIIAGKLTSIPAIQIYVTKKRARAELPSEELIPTSIEGVDSDVLEGMFPVEMSATIRCRRGAITAVDIPVANGPVEITSPGHGLTNGTRVRIFGALLAGDIAVPITLKDPDVFTIPPMDRQKDEVPSFASWTEINSFDNGMCCCTSGQITDTTNGNPVKITSPAHGLVGGDRVRINHITIMTQIKEKEFVVGKTTPDTFEIKVDGTSFPLPGVGAEHGEWAKLCADRTGEIQSVVMGAPVVFTSNGHALKSKDRVHIITPRDDLKISSWDKDEPYTVATVTADTFTVKELSNVGTGQHTIVGCWIRIFSDGRMYSRVRGGIRISMSRDEVISKRKPLINTRSTQTGDNPISSDDPITVNTDITYGTLGCLATEKGTDKKVLLSNYHVLYSVKGEENVHHPDYSCCKSHRIGIRMRHGPPGTLTVASTVDAAIAGLTEPSKADPTIVDIGDVQDTATITLTDIVTPVQIATDPPPTGVVRGYRVRKRGITTLVTEGIVIGLEATFNGPDKLVPVFLKNQILIQPMAGEGRGAITLKGDSGSALVNDDNKVVGLVHGADHLGRGFASPIADVERELNITILKATSSTPGTGGAGGTPVTADDLVIIPPIPDLLVAVASEVSATREGAHLVSLVMGHHQEVEHLVHHDRRVTVAWHRNGGPSFLRELHELVVRRDIPLPPMVEGRPVRQCVENLFDALRQSGSAKLAADVERYGRELAELSTLSYASMLEMLAARAEAPRG